MAQIGPEVPVSPPPYLKGWGGFLPTLRLLNLVEEAEEPQPWEMGQVHRPEGCGTAKIIAPCSDDELVVDDQPDNVIALPFGVYGDDGCSTWGYQAYDYAERVRRAKLNLTLKESNTIASEFWTGAKATAEGWPNPSLRGSSLALLPIGTPSPYRLALGALQDAIGACLGDGQAGMIFATRSTVSTWWQSGLLSYDEDEGIHRDIFGNIVIGSGGFDGSAPDGSVTSTAPWAYATGTIYVRLGQLTDVTDGKVSAALNRASNDIDVFAQRLVTVTMDECCVFGIGVDLCCNNCSTDVGGGGE